MNKEIQINENKNMNEQKTRWYDEDLPSLIEYDLRRSLYFSNRTWALNFANPKEIGVYSWNEEFNVMIQNVGDYRVRCILAMDSYDARIGLAMFKSTFGAVGVEFEVGEYTVVAPVVEPIEPDTTETKPVTEPGMEVV